MKRSRSLRFRTMCLFCAVVGVLLVASYAAIYSFLTREILVQYDKRLVAAATPVAAELSGKALGTETLGPETLGPDTLGLEVFAPETLVIKYVEVLDGDGRILHRSNTLNGETLSAPTANLGSAQATFKTIKAPRLGELRMALLPYKQAGQGRFLLLAASTKCPAQVITRFRNLLLMLLSLNLLLTGILSAWYTGRSLAPVTELTHRAAEMSERVSRSGSRSLWTPLTVTNPDDELGRLAVTFNILAQSVEGAMRQLRQFVSDASHELRTPLTVLQGETELVLAEPRTPTEYRRALLIIHGELRKLNRMVEGLFTLSMADAGQLRLLKEPVYVNEVLEESCAMATPLASAKGIRIERDLHDEISLVGDEGFLRELFLIFLDNAVKYSPPNTEVRVNLQRVNGSVRAQFEDHGIGIPPEHVPRIFERFYRAAPKASGETQSGGLGLAIAQAIVQAHSGCIDCETVMRQGSKFTVTLPIEMSN